MISDSWTAIVVAAGEGKRMRSATPKVLHPILGSSMVEWVVEAIRTAGAARIVVVLSPSSSERAPSSLRSNNIEIALQTKPLGTGDAVACARDTLERWTGPVVVACGDSPAIRPSTVSSLVQAHNDNGAAMTLAISRPADPSGYGRIERDAEGKPCGIVEEAAASKNQLLNNEVNSGLYCFSGRHLWRWLDQISPSQVGEYYLTDVLEMAYREGAGIAEVTADSAELAGVNNRAQLTEAASHLRGRVNEEFMLAGVTIGDPATTWIEPSVQIAADVTLLPNVYLRGNTVVECGTIIGPGTEIVDSRIGSHSTIRWSVVAESTVGNNVTIGPFSHLRPGSRVGNDVHIGSFAELKNSRLGPMTRMPHFSYLGDADVGAEVNIGAGTITCNYDGESGRKSATIIGDKASIGSDTMLVAPRRIGRGALTGAGSVVTHDLAPDDVAHGVPARVVRKRRKDSKGSNER